MTSSENINAIEILTGSKHYSDLFDSFHTKDHLKVDPKKTDVSEAIFFHIAKMKLAGWRHTEIFKRGRSHPFSEFFQDIIAFYLKVSLSSDYSIELETKLKTSKGPTQVDIAVKRKNKYIFLIEVKTNLGFDRPKYHTLKPYKKFEDRIHMLSNNYKVPKKNSIFVIQDVGNVSKAFSDIYLDKDKKRRPRPTDFPLSNIFPLFDNPDPTYWGIPRKTITNEIIKKRAKCSIVTTFEEILRTIQEADIIT